jgi:hypothetical protein
MMQPLLRFVPRRRCSVIVRVIGFSGRVCVCARARIFREFDRMMQRVEESLLVFYAGGLFLELFAGSLRALYALIHAAYLPPLRKNRRSNRN